MANCILEVKSSGSKWLGLIVQGDILFTAYGEETLVPGPKMFILYNRGGCSGPFDLDDSRFTIHPLTDPTI